VRLLQVAQAHPMPPKSTGATTVHALRPLLRPLTPSHSPSLHSSLIPRSVARICSLPRSRACSVAAALVCVLAAVRAAARPLVSPPTLISANSEYMMRTTTPESAGALPVFSSVCVLPLHRARQVRAVRACCVCMVYACACCSRVPRMHGVCACACLSARAVDACVRTHALACCGCVVCACTCCARAKCVRAFNCARVLSRECALGRGVTA
jgi:hypothetical protein